MVEADFNDDSLRPPVHGASGCCMEDIGQNKSLRDLGKRVRQARMAAGLSQTQLSTLIGVAKQTISAWEGGKSPPMIPNLLKAAAVLRIDATELLSGLSEDLAIKEFAGRRLAASGGLLPLYGNEEECGAAMLKLTTQEARNFLPTSTTHGSKDAAFVVSSRANEPKFYMGDKITLRADDDSLKSIEPGKFVFAFADGRFVFRRYLPKTYGSPDGAKLEAVNPAFPPIFMKDGDKILGVMSVYISENHD